VSYLAAKTAS
jgi:hypothetical protein